ncbi:MAG TPA: YtxH domain-containing protein [Longimicrobiaceae bacterium]|nr:YtxH domain-containing protein [Longimicrobiaceae bacterium]
MGDHEDLPYIVIERRSGAIAPFFWGALVGAGIALLFAPRSGEETQQELRDSARRLRTAAEDRVHDAREAVVGAVERTRDAVQDRVEAVRDAVATGAEQARQAVDAGRDAARDTREDLERRVSAAKSASAFGAGTELDPLGTPPLADTDVVIIETTVIEEDVPRPNLG